MKMSFKTLFCAVMASVMFWACSPEATRPTSEEPSSSSAILNAVIGTEMPVMGNSVVSYQIAGGWSSEFGSKGVVSDMKILKSWFPNDLNNEREECSYFAVYNTTTYTSSGHHVLSQDMVLYSLQPNYASEQCVSGGEIFYEAMLVCDDNAGTLKNKVNLNGIYTVPEWDCGNWETIPEKGHFPAHVITRSSSSSADMSEGEWVCTTGIPEVCSFIRPSIKEMPVMDSNVVSYIKIESYMDNLRSEFITDKNILEAWFPNVFDNNQKEECDYFALAHGVSNYAYMVLAYNDYTSSYDQIMIRPNEYDNKCFRNVVEDCSAKCTEKYLDNDFDKPNLVCIECMEGKNNNLQMEQHAMLVCDDKFGSLKGKIRHYDTRSFNNPVWDCEKGDVKTIDVFF